MARQARIHLSFSGLALLYIILVCLVLIRAANTACSLSKAYRRREHRQSSRRCLYLIWRMVQRQLSKAEQFNIEVPFLLAELSFSSRYDFTRWIVRMECRRFKPVKVKVYALRAMSWIKLAVLRGHQPACLVSLQHFGAQDSLVILSGLREDIDVQNIQVGPLSLSPIALHIVQMAGTRRSLGSA